MHFLATTLIFATALSHTDHELHYVKRGDLKLPFYYPSPVSFTFDKPAGLASFVPNSNFLAEVFGKAYLKEALGVPESDLQVSTVTNTGDGTYHIYSNRLINGIPVANQNAAVHIAGGNVISESSSFLGKEGETIAPAEVKISLEDAVKKAEQVYGAKRDETPAKLMYVEIPGKKIVYCHVFQLKALEKGIALQVFVDAANGQIVQVVNFSSSATYKVLKLPKISPLDGFVVDVNPEYANASPNGWTFEPLTVGNNALSLNNVGAPVQDSSAGTFEYPFNINDGPSNVVNQKAGAVNSFYIANKMHDIMYQYGFDEQSGNFQIQNFDKGGDQFDPVLVFNQYADSPNNAFFISPPDGLAPVLVLGIFDATTPNRDASLDNSVIIHEYTHGISTRLTGGRLNSDCLQSLEAGGMGEGWSDIFAFMLTQNGTETRKTSYPMGSYVTNNFVSGIRKYPYSTYDSKNPLEYSDLSKMSEVHEIGTVWASMLHDLYWNLVDVYGFSPDWMNPNQLKGNIILLNLLIAGMKLQPCNPTFLNARDAILAADQVIYNGKNKCYIWIAFAERGLGVRARFDSKYRDSGKIPDECRDVKIRPLKNV